MKTNGDRKRFVVFRSALTVSERRAAVRDTHANRGAGLELQRDAVVAFGIGGLSELEFRDHDLS